MTETNFLSNVTSATDFKTHFSNLGIVSNSKYKHNEYKLYFRSRMVVLKIYVPYFLEGETHMSLNFWPKYPILSAILGNLNLVFHLNLV